jgi:flagellar hook-associated protein 2
MAELARIRQILHYGHEPEYGADDAKRRAIDAHALENLCCAGVGMLACVQLDFDAGGGLTQLVYNPAAATTNLTVLQAAADSQIKIGGFTHNSPTNTVSDAIDGLTLNPKSAAIGAATSVTVSNDSATLASQVQGFISAYNTLVSTLGPLDSYNASTQTAGPLMGDALLRGIQSTINDAVDNPVSGLAGSYTSLASIGVTTQADGTLSLDQSKLTAALNAAPGAVANIFSGANGLVTRVNTNLSATLESGAPLDERNQALQTSQTKINCDEVALNARMQVLQTPYTNQFTALNTLLAQLQSTSSYLTQALAELPKPMSTNNNG